MLRKRTKMIWLTAAVCALCIALMIAVLLQGPRQEIRFTPPPFDDAAVIGVPALTSEDGYGSINATVYTFSVCGSISLEGNRVPVWLTNHAGNEAWLKLKMENEAGEAIGETGLLRPGEYVQYIILDRIPQSTAPVNMVIMGYEPDTYYSVGNVNLQTELNIP